MNLSLSPLKLCVNPNHNYIKIENKCDNKSVFVNKNTINRQQLKQIMSFPKVFIPKLKIKLNESLINNDCLSIHNNNNKNRIKSQIISNNNSLKESNLLSIKEKKRLSTKTNDNQFYYSSNKRFKTISDVNINGGNNEETAKENKNSNQELSRGIGLNNLGNTCYFNSIIQVLRITPGFTQFICYLNKTIINKTKKSISKLNEQNKQIILRLHELFSCLGNKLSINAFNRSHDSIESKVKNLINCQLIRDRFEFGQQHDCHELLNWLINELNQSAEVLFPTKATKEMNSFSAKSVNNSERRITFLDFQGVMLRNIKCSECERSSTTDDSFADIQIPLCLNEDSVDLNESESIGRKSDLQSFTQIIHRTDYLKDENKFECNNCSKKTVASVINSIKISPKILVIYIKKPLEYSETSKKAKSQKKIFKVPLHLEYSSTKSNIEYDLYSFIMHSGSTVNNGHYYSVINTGLKNDSISTRNANCSCGQTIEPNIGWIKVNDNKVRKLNNSHVIKLLEDEYNSSTPYLAFYRIK